MSRRVLCRLVSLTCEQQSVFCKADRLRETEVFVPHRRECNAKVGHSDLCHKDVGMKGKCLPMHDLCEVCCLLLLRRLHAHNLSIRRNQLAAQWKL
eukprot:1856189-Karenia_brevis.AAC.1